MVKTYRVSADVLLPQVPNFLRTVSGQSLPLSALSDNDLQTIGEAWTKALRDRAAEQRKGTP